MADTAQLEATDKPKLPAAGDKSAQPQVAGKPEPPKLDDKPAPAQKSNKTGAAVPMARIRRKGFQSPRLCRGWPSCSCAH